MVGVVALVFAPGLVDRHGPAPTASLSAAVLAPTLSATGDALPAKQPTGAEKALLLLAVVLAALFRPPTPAPRPVRVGVSQPIEPALAWRRPPHRGPPSRG